MLGFRPMAKNLAKPFHVVLGERVKARRRELRLTQDELARRIRGVGGLPWTRSVVNALERGRRELTVPELAIVLAVLDTNWPRLLSGAPTLALSRSTAADAGELAEGVVGRGDLKKIIRVHPEMAERAAEGLKRSLRQVRRLWSGATLGQLEEAEQAISEAELKARKLQVTPREVAFAAYGLWGRSLSEERDARLEIPADSSPEKTKALRGHTTRRLLAELQEVLR
jgi:transcriptional regulator with XRE-family HTH domain